MVFRNNTYTLLLTFSRGMQNRLKRPVNLSLIPSGMNLGNVLSHVLTIKFQCKHCGSMYKTPHLKQNQDFFDNIFHIKLGLKLHPIQKLRSRIEFDMNLDMVAGDAISTSFASKIKFVLGGRAMISPDMRHSFLFSSNTKRSTRWVI